MGTKIEPPEYQYNEIHSDDEDISYEDQQKLRTGISQIYKSQRIEAPKRSEPIREVSEYNLSAVDHKEHQDDSVNVFNLLGVLKEKATHHEIIEKVKKVQKKSKVLPRPVEKIHAEKISRTLGYENVKDQLNRWNSVVQKNKVASQLRFPLQQDKVQLKIAPDRITHFKVPSDLEKEMAAILQESQIAQEDKKEEEECHGLSIEQIIERRQMIGKLRALESYRIAKAVRQNKIKSKNYHRILKREKIKKELKDFERLQKEDPEAALEKLEQLERMRAEERISLRHKNTGKWARSQAIRAKYDPQARIQLAEQLSKSRDLTRKLKRDGDSSSENEELEEDEEEPQKIDGQDNPWNVQKKTVSEVKTFLGGYRKFWEEQNKKEQEKIDESSAKQRIEDEKNVVQRYKEALNGFVQGSVLDSLKENDNLEIIEEEEKTTDDGTNIVHNDDVSNGDTLSVNGLKTQKDMETKKMGEESADGVERRNYDSFSEKKEEEITEIISNLGSVKTFVQQSVSNASKAVSNSPVSTSPKEVSKSPESVSKSPKVVSNSLINETKEMQICDKTNKLISFDEKSVDNFEDSKVNDDSPKSSENDEVNLSNNSQLDEPIVKRTRYAISSKNMGKKQKIIIINNSGAWEIIEQCEGSILGKNNVSKTGENTTRKKSYVKKSINDIFENSEEYINENVKKSVEAIRKDLNDESESELDDVNRKGKGNSSKLNSFDFKNKIRKSDIDEELLEVPMDGISSGQNDLRSIKDKLTNNNVNDKTGKDTSAEPQINPNIFMKAVPMESGVADLEEGGDTDSEDEKSRRNRASHLEAFAEDDIDEEFRQEKEEESKKSAAQEINLHLPGWGSWGGPNISSQGPKGNRRKRRRLILNLPRLPRKDERKEKVIINEDPVSKLREHLVNELPYPFTCVKDYEASIRAPLGKTWVTETAFKKLTAPSVVTKMGTIIDPMDEAQLFKPSKRKYTKKKPAQKI